MPQGHPQDSSEPVATDVTALLRLLQFADSALPVGGASHSFGLETLAEDGALEPTNVEAFLNGYLEECGLIDAIYVRHSWQGDNRRRLNEELNARKTARETREASLKLGRRLAELLNGVAGCAKPIETDLHYSIAFGAVAFHFGIPLEVTIPAYLHQSIAGLISACQRLMPLGQAAAAGILWRLKPKIARISELSYAGEASCFNPFLELASMRHATQETRLFIS